jgi:hydroxypyruvate isomerase
MFRKPSSQSQSISDTQITGSQVQQGQAEQVLIQNQTGDLSVRQQGLSGTEVLKLLEDLESIIKAANLPEKTISKSLNCLQVAKDEAEEKDANKDLIAQNLKKVSEALETVDKATDTGKSLWQKGQEVFKAIAPWLGTAAKLIGF